MLKTLRKIAIHFDAIHNELHDFLQCILQYTWMQHEIIKSLGRDRIWILLQIFSEEKPQWT